MKSDNDCFVIIQASDLHCGGSDFISELMDIFLDKTREIDPDLVVVAGDLTEKGYRDQFDMAYEYLSKITQPKLVVPGNHDSRNVGFVHFQALFGPSFKSYRSPFSKEKAAAMGATGCTIVGADSSNPDLNEGSIGFHRYEWIENQYRHPDDIKLFVLHHHLVGVPGTGKERNIVWDAGDILSLIGAMGVDMVISGHKHVPYFWDLNGMLVSNSSTACTRKLRGLTPASFNEIRITRERIEVFLHYSNGTRGQALRFKRKGWEKGHEEFSMTDDFMQRNGFTRLQPFVSH